MGNTSIAKQHITIGGLSDSVVYVAVLRQGSPEYKRDEAIRRGGLSSERHFSYEACKGCSGCGAADAMEIWAVSLDEHGHPTPLWPLP